jgi:hypothetical protein
VGLSTHQIGCLTMHMYSECYIQEHREYVGNRNPREHARSGKRQLRLPLVSLC